MNDIICRCAEKAKEKKYSHFGVQNYGKCIGPVDVLPRHSSVYPKYNVSFTRTIFVEEHLFITDSSLGL